MVTLEREYGSGGADIARKLAQRLRWKLWDQALTDEIARLMECPSRTVEERQERRDPLHYRLLKSFMRGSFEGTLNAPQLTRVDADYILAVTQRIVTTIAEEGSAVMVGRGSAFHLQGRPDAYHVFVYAPFEERVRRLQLTGKGKAEAEELAETVDRERSEYIKQYFKIEWPARHFFHLMVNTKIGDEAVVDTILNSVSQLERQPA
jgi:cytidylate kinase